MDYREIYTVVMYEEGSDGTLLRRIIAGRMLVDGGSLLFTIQRENGGFMAYKVFAPGTWKEAYLSDREGNPIELD